MELVPGDKNHSVESSIMRKVQNPRLDYLNLVRFSIVWVAFGRTKSKFKLEYTSLYTKYTMY